MHGNKKKFPATTTQEERNLLVHQHIFSIFFVEVSSPSTGSDKNMGREGQLNERHYYHRYIKYSSM